MAKKKRRTAKKKIAARGLSEDQITLDSMYNAYRKAKQDVFAEKTQAHAIEFAAYERHLNENLDALRERLISTKPDWWKDLQFIGAYGLIPKDWEFPTRPEDPSGPHF